MAWLFLAVLLFELSAWTLLFNAIFHSDVLGRSWWSLLAFALGLLYAFAIVFFDRSFFVSDTKDKKNAKIFPTIARLSLILFSAFGTGLAIDLIFFQYPIKKRIHEERLRWYMVAFVSELEKESGERSENANEEEARRLYSEALKALNEAKKKRITFLEKRANYNSASARHRQQANRLRNQISDIDTRLRDPYLESEERERYQNEVKDLRSEAISLEQKSASNATQASLKDTKISDLNIATLEKEVADKKKELDKQGIGLAEDLVLANELLEEKKKKIEQWIHMYRVTDPDSDIPKLPSALASKVYGQPPKYNIFDQYRVLFDLQAPRPPLWPLAPGKTIRDLKKDFLLQDPAPCSSTSEELDSFGQNLQEAADPCDPLVWDRVMKEAWFYWTAMWVVFAMAAVIPLLVLVIKVLLMPRQLANYYSLRHQAAAGEPDALLDLYVDQRAAREIEDETYPFP